MRRRGAPIATRTATSWVRALARASRRFAMFEHATSSTTATTIAMICNGSRVPSRVSTCPRLPGSSSTRGRSFSARAGRFGNDGLFDDGVECGLCRVCVTPGFKRAASNTHQKLGLSCSFERSRRGCRAERHEHVRCVADLKRAVKAARRDADDRDGNAVDRDRSAR